MLRTILSIAGKPGLYKLISQGKNMVVVESLTTGKRQPAYSHDKIISLGDISIYTNEEEVPLRQVFETIFKKEDGKEIIMPAKGDNDSLMSYFREILPTFDQERVYPNDVKKILSWYNTLVSKGLTEFDKKEKEEDVEN